MKTTLRRILIAMLLLGIAAMHGFPQSSDLPGGLYAVMETSKGTIVLALEFEKAPLTVANFVGLAEGSIDSILNGAPYFDGLTFHRVIDDFMIQSGDPKGDGTGGPGYTFPDEFHPQLRHSGPGILSMANRGANTNGSQFFITHTATPWLDDRHAVFGRVVEGMEVVNAVKQGDRIIRVSIIRKGAAALGFQVSPKSFNKLIEEAGERQEQLAAEKRRADMDLIESRWPDAQKTRSGMSYVVIRRGSGGKKPGNGAVVKVHYQGSLLNGAVFDSSTGGDPVVFRIGEVIEGWNLTLKEMTKGEKRLVIIPPELAYGSQGYPGIIPPNSFLVFEIELIEF